MKQLKKWLAALAVAAALPVADAAATVGGVDYSPLYDFHEFYFATHGRKFRVVSSGNPFPALPLDVMQARILPVMQANRPRPRLTFTYEVPPEPPRPEYRMVLVFDPANDLGAQRVCNHDFRHRPQTPGRVYVFAVYCRNDQVMSQTTAWTDATSPEDPRLGQMFGELFLVLFTELPLNRRFMPFGIWR